MLTLRNVKGLTMKKIMILEVIATKKVDGLVRAINDQFGNLKV